MLPKQNRITENREFLRIFKTVRPVHTEHMTFRVAKGRPPTNLRIEQKYESTNNTKIAASRKGIGSRNDNDDAKKLMPNTCHLPPRFGFVISNKIDKRSSRRNGMKRRIRAVVEENLAKFPEGVDVVIQVKKAFPYPYNYEIIKHEVKEELSKIGIVFEKS